MSMQRVEEKIDCTNAHLGRLEIILERNTVSLEHHIKRTDILEARVDSVLPKILWSLSIVSAVVVLAKQLM